MNPDGQGGSLADWPRIGVRVNPEPIRADYRTCADSSLKLVIWILDEVESHDGIILISSFDESSSGDDELFMNAL